MIRGLLENGQASARKLRLFALAAWRGISLWVNDRRCQNAIDRIEMLLEGIASVEDLATASQEAEGAFGETIAPFYRYPPLPPEAIYPAVQAERHLIFMQPLDNYILLERVASLEALVRDCAPPKVWATEQCREVELLRDIFNPMRDLAALVPSPLLRKESLLVQLAEAAYQDRQLPEGTLDSTRLGVLADALEDAGLVDTELVEHLRGPHLHWPTPHWRGCWVIDLLTGRS